MSPSCSYTPSLLSHRISRRVLGNIWRANRVGIITLSTGVWENELTELGDGSNGDILQRNDGAHDYAHHEQGAAR